MEHYQQQQQQQGKNKVTCHSDVAGVAHCCHVYRGPLGVIRDRSVHSFHSRAWLQAICLVVSGTRAVHNIGTLAPMLVPGNLLIELALVRPVLLPGGFSIGCLLPARERMGDWLMGYDLC